MAHLHWGQEPLELDESHTEVLQEHTEKETLLARMERLFLVVVASSQTSS